MKKKPENKQLDKILASISKFFDKRKRMPTYSEIAGLLGLASKESAYRQVQKLIALNILSKDKQGKLLPPKSLLHSTKDSRATFVPSSYLGKAPVSNLSVPILGLVEAGFPSDAESQSLDLISLDEWLISSPQSSFILKVKGDSMIDAGVRDGDHVLVDTKKVAKIGDMVIAHIDGGFTLKYLKQKNNTYYLEPANKDFLDMYPNEELEIQAVVVAVIRSMR